MCVCVSVCTHNYTGLFSVLLCIWELSGYILLSMHDPRFGKPLRGPGRGPTGGPTPAHHRC